MRYFSLVCCVLFSTALFSQELKPIAKKITEFHRSGSEFRQYGIFTKNTSPEKTRKYQEMATDATVLVLNPEVLARLMAERPETVEISFPYKSSQITVELYKENILTAGFEATDQEGQLLEYDPGAYYRGIVKNDPTSIVAFSFFDDDVIGIASSLDKGNIVVGKVKNASDYLSYSSHTLVGENPFRCGFDGLEENQKRMVSQETATTAQKSNTINCVRVYYEVAYQPYVEHFWNITATLDWLTAVHNNISTLYANDNITVSMSSTMVWTSPDPYVHGYSQNLSLFKNTRTSFYGDLAHLVNTPSTTSVAYLDSLCGDWNYAYSGINMTYQAVPTYSWTVGAMTHEMGHSLGSPHTHDCFWNGNGTAIDGCGPTADPAYDEGCTGPIPPTGGTIMSYCHLLSGVGVNFANGFGAQPAAHISNTIDSKWCLGWDCSCMATISAMEISNITTSSVDVDITDVTSTSWDYRIYKYGTSPTSWTNTASKSFNVSGLLPNTYYVFEMGNVCSSGTVAFNVKKLFLTDGNYCGGDKFTDTGGIIWDYDDNEYFVKTFYPQVANDKVLLTFTQFDLEAGYDFMNIYDGEDTNALIFANGMDLTGNTIPGPFQATNASGAITVEFESDYGMGHPGWEATISCLLGTEQFSSNPQITLYPNPANSIVTIESNKLIKELKVFDMAGRLVKDIQEINSSNTKFSVENLGNGMYFIHVSAEGGSQVLRIIKE